MIDDRTNASCKQALGWFLIEASPKHLGKGLLQQAVCNARAGRWTLSLSCHLECSEPAAVSLRFDMHDSTQDSYACHGYIVQKGERHQCQRSSISCRCVAQAVTAYPLRCTHTILRYTQEADCDCLLSVHVHPLPSLSVDEKRWCSVQLEFLHMCQC